jgi:hypothetical protein
MRRTSKVREWVFALGIMAVFSAAAFYLLGERLSAPTGSGMNGASGAPFGRAEAANGSGTIIRREHGQCRQVTFDKVTGEIQDNSVGPCPQGSGMAANSTEGRMQSIRQTFSGR